MGFRRTFDRINACPGPERWPAPDRAAWGLALQRARSPFRKDGGGRERSPVTVRSVGYAYGRFLTYLGFAWPERLALEPDKRPTADVLDAYFDHLGEMGCAAMTVINYFRGLRAALTWMYPGKDFSFITKPGGVPLARHAAVTARDRPVPLEGALRACARQLFEMAQRSPGGVRRRARMRDAAMLGILIEIAPRVRTLSLLKLGRHVRRVGDDWWVMQTPDITKTGLRSGRTIDMPVSSEVGAWLSRYVDEERPEMLRAAAPQEHLWVNQHGDPLSIAAIQTIVRRRTGRALAQAIGPHAFRASLATTDAVDGASHCLDASVRLGHADATTTLQFYKRATAMAAGRRHGERLQRLRSNLEEALKGERSSR